MFHGVALHPYTCDYQRLERYVEEVRDVLKAEPRRRQGHVDHRGRLELEARPTAGRLLRQRARRPGAPSSRAPSACSRAGQAKWHVQRVYWFSIDDQPGSCNFCDGSGLFGKGFVPKPSWKAYVKFAGGAPAEQLRGWWRGEDGDPLPGNCVARACA